MRFNHQYLEMEGTAAERTAFADARQGMVWIETDTDLAYQYVEGAWVRMNPQGVEDVAFTIGAEAANVIRVTVQAKTARGANLAVAGTLHAYLSDDAAGDGLNATAPDGGVAAGTAGKLIETVADKVFLLKLSTAGKIEIDLTHAAGAKTVYLVVVLPNGLLKISGAISFA